MLKRLTPVLMLLLGLVACYGFIAAKTPLAGKQYDYVTLTQDGERLYICSPPDHYEQTRTKMDKSGFSGNFTPLLAKVNEYEAQGYELVTNSAFAAGSTGFYTNYVLLRRPRQ